MSSPSDHWAPYSSRRRRVLERRSYRRHMRRAIVADRRQEAPAWWEPLAVLSLCSLLGWLAWYVAFGDWR